MASNSDLVLGYDIGTSSVKVGLFDRVGGVVADQRASYPLLTPKSGWAEQRPEDWWQAICVATRTALRESGVAPDRIVAMAFAAQMAGAVPVARDGTALSNALIWLDTRSAPIARRIVGGPIRIHGYGLGALARWLWLTNGLPNREGRDPTSKYLWFREQRPDLWPQVHKLLDVKDYLLGRATGRFATTADCAHLTWLMDSRPGRGRWSRRLLRRLDLASSYLPEIVSSTHLAGTLKPEAASALGLTDATLVAAGAGDLTAFALGAGRLASGALHLHIGTSNWWGCHLDGRKVDVRTGIGTIAAAQSGRYLLVAAQESAGACVEWAARVFGFERDGEADFALFDQAADEASIELEAPIFLPWLHGERVPVDDRDLRAGFTGLSLSDDRSRLARAVLEGVAFNVRWALEAFEKTARVTHPTVRFLGGGAKSLIWSQILADVLQRPLEVMAEPELGGARGAAMTAAVAAGWFDNLEDAVGLTRIGNSVSPEVGMARHYDERFRRFLQHYRRIHG